jgi:FixJ family two-component response regulator
VRRKSISADSKGSVSRANVSADHSAPAMYLISASWLMRHSQERLFQALQRPVRSFPSLSVFLSLFDGRHGCICLDTEELERALSQALGLLRQHTSRSPIILLSDGLPASRRDEFVCNYAPLCVLTKPVSAQKLLAAVDEMLPRPPRDSGK